MPTRMTQARTRRRTDRRSSRARPARRRSAARPHRRGARSAATRRGRGRPARSEPERPPLDYEVRMVRVTRDTPDKDWERARERESRERFMLRTREGDGPGQDAR